MTSKSQPFYPQAMKRVAAILPVLLTFVYMLVGRAWIDDRVAIHWPSGATVPADGFYVGAIVVLLLVTALAWKATSLAALAGVSAFISATIASCLTATILSPGEPRLEWWAGLAMGVSPVYALFFRGRRQRIPMVKTDSTWRGTYWSSLYAWVAVGTAVVGMVVVLTIATEPSLRWFFVVFFLALTAASLAMVRIRVDVSANGLVVRTAIPWVRIKRIPVQQVQNIETTVIEPGEWGGWGYRVLPGKGTSLVLRRSMGIVVTLRDASRFAITLPSDGDADHAAAALRAEVSSANQKEMKG